jgi:hypothetical protein
MVTFTQLRQAKPQLWTSAANDMRSAALQCERVRDDIHQNGVQPLDEHWPDHVGELAKSALTSIAGRAEVSAILARSTVDPLDTLNHAVVIAQNELENGIRLAEGAGFLVNPDTGDITVPPTMTQDQLNAKMATLTQAHQLINDAIEAATQADDLCTAALNDTDRDADTTDVDEARKVQALNTQRALEELRDTIPDGLPPDDVSRWWNGLTPQEQTDLQRACPAELYDLNGIPDSVKKTIDRPELGYSSVGAVKYAIENWNNSDLDVFKDNCTNFVSDSLSYGGGMPQKEDWWLPRHFDTDGWSDGTAGNSDPFPPGLSHTPTWAAAQNNRDFFLRNGGSVVDPSQAKPGDVVYYTMTQDGEGMHAGETHHAAVVTGVLPDGQVLYTQHSDAGKNLPLFGRLPEFEQTYGQQKIEIVAPRVTW